jgi:hypothetical protein
VREGGKRSRGQSDGSALSHSLGWCWDVECKDDAKPAVERQFGRS